MESDRQFGSGGDAPQIESSRRLFGEIAMNPREPGGSRPPGNMPGHLPDVQITGGDTNVQVNNDTHVRAEVDSRSSAAAQSSAQGGRGGDAQGGQGGDGGQGGSGGESRVRIDNSDRGTYNSVFWAPSREATQGIPPGTMGGRLDVTLPTGRVNHETYGPPSSSAFNLSGDAAIPGFGGFGIGIGTAHTGDAPKEVRNAVTDMNVRAGRVLDHILMKDR